MTTCTAWASLVVPCRARGSLKRNDGILTLRLVVGNCGAPISVWWEWSRSVLTSSQPAVEGVRGIEDRVGKLAVASAAFGRAARPGASQLPESQYLRCRVRRGSGSGDAGLAWRAGG